MATELTDQRRVGVVGPASRTSSPPEAEAGEVGTSADASCAQLIELLHDVAESVRAGRYLADRREGILVDTVVGRTRCLLLVHEPALVVQLSPREIEVARMVAEGRTNQAIAGSLDISVWTVSTHLRRIFAKLAVSSRAGMVAHLLDHHELSHLAARRPR